MDSKSELTEVMAVFGARIRELVNSDAMAQAIESKLHKMGVERTVLEVSYHMGSGYTVGKVPNVVPNVLDKLKLKSAGILWDEPSPQEGIG